MRILLSNDDGLFSNGLIHLEEQLSLRHEVWAVAPDRERSATSHAISIRETLRLTRVDDRHYHLNGFPVDCVNVALFSNAFPAFDLLISGINHGVNMGDDVHFSGTVAAARHAAIHNLPALAVSAPICTKDGNFKRAALWLSDFIDESASLLKRGIVYNINYPDEKEFQEGTFCTSYKNLPEYMATYQGKRIYNDRYDILEEGHDYRIFRLQGSAMGEIGEHHSDFDAFRKGYVGITPLSLRTTDLDEYELWKKRARERIEF